MSLGINISTDFRQVTAARKEIEKVNGLLTGMNGAADVAIGGPGLAKDADILRQISSDITRLKNLSAVGVGKGGVLNSQQFKEAAELSQKVGTNMAAWESSISKTRKELGALYREINDLGKVSSADAHRWGSAQERISVLKGQLADKQKEYRGLDAHDRTAGHLRERGAEYTGNIAAYGQQGPGGGTGALSAITGLLKPMLMIAGFAGIGSLVGKSLSAYHDFNTTSTDMGNMGLAGISSGRSGYKMKERGDFMMNVARSTGYSGEGGMDAMLDLARSRNVSTDTMSQFATGGYKATGLKENEMTGLITSVFAQTKDSKRQTDLLEGTVRLLSSIASTQGGILSKAQIADVTGMFTKGFDKDNPLTQNTGIYEKLNSGLAGGGKNPGEQALFWELAGGNKNGNSWEGIYNTKKAMSEGLSNKGFRDNFTDKLRGYKDKYQRLLALQTMMPGMQIGEAETAMSVLDKTYGMDNKDILKNLGDDTTSKTIRDGMTAGHGAGASRDQDVNSESAYVGAGKILGPPMLKLEKALVDVSKSFIGSISRIHSVGDVFAEGAKEIPKAIEKMWDEGGPFGKLLVMTGGILAAVRAAGMVSGGADFLSKLAGQGSTVGRGLGLAGPIGASILAFAAVSKAVEIANTDDVHDIKHFDKKKSAKLVEEGNRITAENNDINLSLNKLDKTMGLLNAWLDQYKPYASDANGMHEKQEKKFQAHQ